MAARRDKTFVVENPWFPIGRIVQRVQRSQNVGEDDVAKFPRGLGKRNQLINTQKCHQNSMFMSFLLGTSKNDAPLLQKITTEPRTQIKIKNETDVGMSRICSLVTSTDACRRKFKRAFK